MRLSWKDESFSVNLYKEYGSLRSRELKELSHFQVMSWQPFFFAVVCIALLIWVTLTIYKGIVLFIG